MDTAYMSELVLSMLVFAPGIVLLTVAIFIGILVAFEKLGVFDSFIRSRSKGRATAGEATSAATNPPPGPIVSDLKRSISAAENKDERHDRTA